MTSLVLLLIVGFTGFGIGVITAKLAIKPKYIAETVYIPEIVVIPYGHERKSTLH